MKKPTWIDRYFLVIVVIAAAITTALSLLIGMNQSVWFDEAYSIMVAKQSLDQLLHLAAIDTHPPLYYIILKGWAALFGWSELALRSLSVLALGGSVILSGLLLRRGFGARAAVTVMPFLVIAPFLLRYGFEIRMYVIGSFIGIAATYVLVRALQAKTSKAQWLLYGLYAALVAAGVYTLYYLALLWIAHVVWLVWLTIRERKSLLRARWWLAYVGSVVLFLPWLPTFLSQVNNGALAQISQPLTIDNMLGIASFNFVYQPTWQLTAFVSLLVLFVISAVVYFSIKAFKVVKAKERPYLMLLAMYLAIPVAVLAIVSLFKPMYVERYLAHVAIGGMLYVGVVVALALRKKATTVEWTLAGVLLVVLLSGTVQLARVGNFNFQRMQTPTVAAAAAAVKACDAQSAVVAADPYVAIELAYYLPDCQIHFYSETVSLGGGYAPLSDSPLHVTNPVKLTAEKIYYVYYGDPELQMPEGHARVSEQTFEALHVETFSAE